MNITNIRASFLPSVDRSTPDNPTVALGISFDVDGKQTGFVAVAEHSQAGEKTALEAAIEDLFRQTFEALK